MRIHAIGIAACLALLAQGIALAQSPDMRSANTVMRGCRDNSKDDVPAIFLSGYCAGIVRAMFQFSSRLGFCVPDGAEAGQAQRVVVAYIDQRPERMHETFDFLALEALRRAWPCRRQ